MVVLFFFKGTFLHRVLLFLAVSLASSAQFFLVVVFEHSVGFLSLPTGSFEWHSLRPSSTQLLVCNHSGFCSH